MALLELADHSLQRLVLRSSIQKLLVLWGNLTHSQKRSSFIIYCMQHLGINLIRSVVIRNDYGGESDRGGGGGGSSDDKCGVIMMVV